MGSLGVPELIVIFVVALLVFGPKKLPELGKSLGKGLAEFKRASDDLKRTIEAETNQGKREPPEAKSQVAEFRPPPAAPPPLEDPRPASPAAPEATVPRVES